MSNFWRGHGVYLLFWDHRLHPLKIVPGATNSNNRWHIAYKHDLSISPNWATNQTAKRTNNKHFTALLSPVPFFQRFPNPPGTPGWWGKGEECFRAAKSAFGYHHYFHALFLHIPFIALLFSRFSSIFASETIPINFHTFEHKSKSLLLARPPRDKKQNQTIPDPPENNFPLRSKIRFFLPLNSCQIVITVEFATRHGFTAWWKNIENLKYMTFIRMFEGTSKEIYIQDSREEANSVCTLWLFHHKKNLA